MWTVSRNMNCAFNPRENTRRGSSHAHMKCIRQHSRTPPSTTHVWLSRQGEETLSSALTSQLLPREKRIVSQNQRRRVFDNVAQRSRDWISFISYGSCCVLASSLSRWLASNPFGCSNNNRHTNLTLSRYRTYEWNKLILSLELTEHTWISRDVGGDQISCTLIWGSKFPNERLSFIFPTKGTCVSVTLSRLYICKNVHVRDHFVIFAFVRSSQ